jgi:signal transduction histidine kinase
MMFQSLRSRLLALLTAVVVLAVAAIGLASATLVRSTISDTIRSELREQARVLRAGDNGLDRALEIEANSSSQVFVVDAKLPAAYASQIARLDRTDESSRPKLHPNSKLQLVEWTQAGSKGHGDKEWVGYLVKAGGVPGNGGLVVALPQPKTTGGWEKIAVRVAAILLVLLLLVWFVALWISYRLTAPLERLVAATHDIALGRWSAGQLPDVDRGDEIGQLATAFRDMALRLREVDSRDRRFLMSISHELRTPLTAITGHAQALQDGLAEDPATRDRSLAVIQREAGRLDRLVEDIIDLARLRSNRFNTVSESVQLDELGDHLLGIYDDRSVHEDITVRGTFEDVTFVSDGQRILQILRNLINNGLRYARSEVLVEGERVRGRIRLTVTNDGEPIPVEMHERIFEPFVGAKREGGMGLGLAIGRELAWALGGNLRIVPTDDGACFELTLPLEPPGSGR